MVKDKETIDKVERKCLEAIESVSFWRNRRTRKKRKDIRSWEGYYI